MGECQHVDAYARRLEEQLKAGEIEKWEPGRDYPLDINGIYIGTYHPHFEVHYFDGRLDFVEIVCLANFTEHLPRTIFDALYGRMPGTRLLIIRP